MLAVLRFSSRVPSQYDTMPVPPQSEHDMDDGTIRGGPNSVGWIENDKLRRGRIAGRQPR